VVVPADSREVLVEAPRPVRHVRAVVSDLDLDGAAMVIEDNAAPFPAPLAAAEDPGTAGHKVSGVVEAVESDEVAVEERVENLWPGKNLRRPVEDEPETGSVELSPEESREDHEMVVVDPHVVLVRVQDRLDRFREGLVGFHVGSPIRLVVTLLLRFGLEKHRNATELLELGLDFEIFLPRIRVVGG